VQRLANKVAIITGGASGIGEATVRRFVAEGARVVIADIQDQRGRQIAESLGANASYRHVDVGAESDVRGAIAFAVEKFGRLDILFNNAGFGGPGGPVETLETDGWDTTMAVLLRGPFLGMKHAAPIMKRQGAGSIISTASVAGLVTGFGSHIYSAAKAALVHLTRSVATELGESGVRVNCICPGGIATPIFGRAVGLDAEKADASVSMMRNLLQTAQPIRRTGLPEDIALAALWLASDESTFVNGHALVVDGGLACGNMWSPSQERRMALRAALTR
jgi:NAD(P)-dependent dehydrogenase (short-subunit alcohol dehydrogenase family)